MGKECTHVTTDEFGLWGQRRKASVRKLLQSAEEVPNWTAQDKAYERRHLAGPTVHGAGRQMGLPSKLATAS